MTGSAALLAAADVLEADGFRGGTLGRPGQPKCVIGALRHVITGDPETPPSLMSAEGCEVYHDARIRLAAVLPPHPLPPYVYDPVLAWADAPGRTCEEVAAMMRTAAESDPTSG